MFPAPGPTIPVTVQSTNYTFGPMDAFTRVESSAAGGVTFTIPANIFTVGQWIEVGQVGAGQITLAAGAGVTINSDGNLLHTKAQHAVIGILCRAANIFVLSGDLG